ncbi:MAG: hypothetical protein U9R17_12660 [Thermodesulfobacteriota bacterium]|nr:hypothetical protein [Thermodesulfobacteriota bacterium]
MAENDAVYWQQWQKLLDAAANIQGLLPGSVMIGGSAAAIHLKHCKGIKPPFDTWDNITEICEKISVALGDSLDELQPFPNEH